jgi:hypothetical protein
MEQVIADRASDESFSLRLDDLDLEGLTLVELSEEVRGHPENLASSKICCCCVSTILPTLA